MTRLTKNGISTTTARDCFRYEEFVGSFDKKLRVQWDYRDAAGKLHSGIAKSLSQAKQQARQYGYEG